MVAAFKFDDFVAVGKTACQTDGSHRRFRAGADEAQPFDRRHNFGNLFGNGDFAFGGRAERQTAQRSFAHGFDDFGMRVSDNRILSRADIIGVARAVFVPNIRAFGFLMKRGTPPTLPNARTGEFTPPGMMALARSNKISLRFIFILKCRLNGRFRAWKQKAPFYHFQVATRICPLLCGLRQPYPG